VGKEFWILVVAAAAAVNQSINQSIDRSINQSTLELEEF
jgi:hypothetical protein